MKLFASLLLMTLSCASVVGQTDIDLLEENLEGREIDTTLVNDFMLLGKHYLKDDSLKSLNYINKAITASAEVHSMLKNGQATFLLGGFYSQYDDYILAAKYYSQALSIFQSIGAVDEELEVTLRLGFNYQYHGETSKAFDVYDAALKRYPEDNSFACVINNAIGTMMKTIHEADEAIFYFDASDEAYNKIENPSALVIDRQLSNDKNRGVLYRNKESYDTAFFYMDRSLQKSIEIADSSWIARNYNSLAIMYQRQGDFDKSIELYEASLSIKRHLGYLDGVVTTLTNIGALYLEMGDLKLAEKYLAEADGMCNGECQEYRQVQVLGSLSELYGKQGRYKLAFEKLNEFISTSDSLQRNSEKEFTRELEARYKNAAAEIEQEKLQAELESSDLREEANNAKLKQQRNYLILGTAGGLVLLLLVVLAVRSNLKRLAANKELSIKNSEVISKSAEIENQKHMIEEQHQEMLDSINYAKRIQDAILPSPQFVKEHLPESFVYYQPKDVLAGDFYWMDIIDDIVIWAAADCTGHGIPGAMVSVVCHNALNRSVHEFHLKDPGKILDCTRELVIETFKKSGMEVKDGMDIALCCFDKKTNKLRFAGANNPLWIIREAKNEQIDEKDFVSENEKFVLREVKGDKQPIGLHYSLDPFISHEVELKENDQLYVFTDGYADQFGGDKGKKLKYKNFKKILLSKAHLDVNEEGSQIQDNFNRWKGDFEQLDDVCVIGVRI